MPILLLPSGSGGSATVSSMWPSIPAPHVIREEPVMDDCLITQFSGGPENRRSRWPRHKKQFTLVYKTIQSGDPTTQNISDHTLIRDFIFAKNFERDSFFFQHPYYPNSIYRVRYNSASLPQQRDVRTPADSGTDVWNMEIRLVEVF